MADSVADCMLTGADPLSSLREGLESSVVCFAIDEAMNSGRVVELDKYWQQVDSVLS